MNRAEKTLVWDLPIRLFHWLLAGAFLGAAALAFLTDDHGALFPYHAVLGTVTTLMVVLRVVWGIVGSKYARFSSFPLRPQGLLVYFKEIISKSAYKHVGHNPASAYVVCAMIFCLLGLAATGFLLGRGEEQVEELHEVLAIAMLVLTGIHIVGVLMHTLSYRENIALSMLSGRKDVDPGAGIKSPHPIIGSVFLLVTLSWAGLVFANYNPANKTLLVPLVRTELQVGDVEDEGYEHHHYHGHDEEGEEH